MNELAVVVFQVCCIPCILGYGESFFNLLMKMSQTLALLTLVAMVSCTLKLKDPYRQIVSSRFLYKNNAQDVSSLSDRHVVASDGVYQYNVEKDGTLQFSPASWSNLPSDVSSCVVRDTDDDMTWLLCASRYYLCSSQSSTCVTSTSFSANAVHDAAPLHNQQQQQRGCLVGTHMGLLTVTAEGGGASLSLHVNAQIKQPVLSVAVSSISGTIAAGTQTYLWRSGVVPSRLHMFKTPGIIDASPAGLAFDASDNLWVVNSVCVNLQHPDLTFERIGGLQGLPISNLTSVSADKHGNVWLGSSYGVMQYKGSSSSQFAYYNGPRYIPGKTVAQSAAIKAVQATSWGAVVANQVGLAVLMEHEYTLYQKSLQIEAIMQRHELTSPRKGQKIPGYLANNCKLGTFGNVSSWIPESSDNSGLWTAIYLTGQIFKYQVTKDPAVKAHAWKYFQGLQFLNHVTGVRGLMARSALYQENIPSFGHWVHSNTSAGWIWKRDTSSDEVDGHFLAYVMVYHFLAETTEEKAQARELINDILHYIIDNGYVLIDVTGKPTTWGRWSPAYLNDDQDWYDERGLNSLQILSWIVSAYGITKDPYYAKAYDYLTSHENTYDINVINTKITQPSDDNYSDDELTYVPLLTYWATHDQASNTLSQRLHPFITKCVNRTWNIVANYRPTPYAAITHMLLGKLPVVGQYEEAVLTVRQWNLEQIDWPMDNSKRIDRLRNPEAQRNGANQFVPPVYPYNEIGAQRWNGNPYSVGTGGAGLSETDAGAFSFAYWTARFTGAF